MSNEANLFVVKWTYQLDGIILRESAAMSKLAADEKASEVRGCGGYAVIHAASKE
jgi:hypothetical protein